MNKKEVENIPHARQCCAGCFEEGFAEAEKKAEVLVEALNKIIEMRIDGFDWPLHCQVAKEALQEYVEKKV
jgi:predicted translin family RNA/ssDNA-binding protein